MTKPLPKKLYKIVHLNGGYPYSLRRGKWHLPKGGRPGKWMPVVRGALEPCANGYHVVGADELCEWAHRGYAVYEVEVDRSEFVDARGKFVVRRARLLRKVGVIGEKLADACCDARNVLRKPIPGARFLARLDKPAPKKKAARK